MKKNASTCQKLLQHPIRQPLLLLWLIITLFGVLPASIRAETPESVAVAAPDSEKPELSTIRLFQKFISPADGDRCPMHPSCSRYAQEAIKQKGLIKGWILTCDRLLRCGRDETRLAPPIYIDGVPHSYDPLAANTFWWKKR